MSPSFTHSPHAPPFQQPPLTEGPQDSSPILELLHDTDRSIPPRPPPPPSPHVPPTSKKTPPPPQTTHRCTQADSQGRGIFEFLLPSLSFCKLGATPSRRIPHKTYSVRASPSYSGPGLSNRSDDTVFHLFVLKVFQHVPQRTSNPPYIPPHVRADPASPKYSGHCWTTEIILSGFKFRHRRSNPLKPSSGHFFLAIVFP